MAPRISSIKRKKNEVNPCVKTNDNKHNTRVKTNDNKHNTRGNTKKVVINRSDMQNRTNKIFFQIEVDLKHANNEKPFDEGAAILENGWVIKTGWWRRNGKFIYVYDGDSV
jgi:hypothetical protein